MTAYTDYETRAIESEARDRAVQGLKDEFLAAVRKGDVYETAFFAPMVPCKYAGSRYPSLGEVLIDAIDYEDFQYCAMEILCAVAYGSEPQTLAARELLDRMAANWADQTYSGE